MEDKYKKGLEKIAALKPADFNAQLEHCSGGNFDDSFEYGIECGEYYAANIARAVLESANKEE